MSSFVDWPARAGPYRYWFLDTPSVRSSIKAEPGNYMFVKLTPTGWLPLYIGQAENLQDRIPNHERWVDAARNGATHVMAHTHGDRTSRLNEESDLIGTWNPVCNQQLRTPGLAASLLLGGSRY